MNAEIVLEGFREHRRSLVWWSFGLIVFTVITLVFIRRSATRPALRDHSKDLPEAMRAMFVGGELDLTSPSGFLNSQIFAVMAPTLLAIFAAAPGLCDRRRRRAWVAGPAARPRFPAPPWSSSSSSGFWPVAILTAVLLATVVLGAGPST